jgi:hypothetical protein
MSTFVDRARSKQQPKLQMTYDDFVRMGCIKPYNLRLPATTIAKLEELQRRLSARFPTSWLSKQEFLFDLLENAIADAIEDEPDQDATKSAMQKVANRALQLMASSGQLQGDDDAAAQTARARRGSRR